MERILLPSSSRRQSTIQSARSTIVSGSTTDRPELNRLLGDLEDGEHVVVWKLDRLGRSLQHLLTLVSGFRSRNIDFTSLTEQVDTSTPGGRVLFSVMGALSEFERDLSVQPIFDATEAIVAHCESWSAS